MPNNALNRRSLRSLDVQKLRFWPPVSLIVREPMGTVRALTYSIMASITVFLLNNFLTVLFLPSLSDHINTASSLGFSLIVWGAPALAVSLFTAKAYPANATTKALLIAFFTCALIFSTTEVINYAPEAPASMLSNLTYLLPFISVAAAVMLGFYFGFKRTIPN